jgi:hypothetical protein
MKRIFLKPKKIKVAGRLVLARLRHPESGMELPADGGFVPAQGKAGSWWRRRVREGCAEEAEPTQEPKSNPKSKAKPVREHDQG